MCGPEKRPVGGSNERLMAIGTFNRRRGMSSVQISIMGSRVTRLMRNFNIENRAHREISKTKPKAAPRHPAPSSSPQEDIAGEKAC